jgi:hypothetical protein
MYALWWRILPGPWWLRALISLLVAAVAVWACFTYLFPLIADHLAINDGTVDGQ